MAEVGLISLLLVALYLVRIKTDARILYTSDKQEIDIETSAGIIGLKIYAVKEGDCKEFSVAVKLMGGLLVMRLDLPVAVLIWKGLEPVISIFREVEVGIGEAKPVGEGGIRIALTRAFAILKRLKKVTYVILPSVKHIGSKTSVERLDLAIIAGTGSAPSTAISAGALWLICENAMVYISKRVKLAENPRVRIVPDFNNRSFRFEAEASSSFRQGEMLTASLLFIAEAVKWAFRAVRIRRENADSQGEAPAEKSSATA